MNGCVLNMPIAMFNAYSIITKCVLMCASVFDDNLFSVKY